MTKTMNNQEIFKILNDNGVEKEDLFAVNKRVKTTKKLKVLTSSEISKSKKRVGGIDYETYMSQSSLDLESFRKEIQFNAPQSEENANILSLCKRFIDFGLEQGHFTTEEYSLYKRFTEARNIVSDLERLRLQNNWTDHEFISELRNASKFNRAVVVLSYGRDLYKTKKQLSEMELFLKESLENPLNIDMDLMSQNWIFNEAMEDMDIAESTKDEIASLIAQKKMVVAQYESLTPAHGLGSSEFSEAYAYAALYLENFRMEQQRISNTFNKALINEIERFKIKYRAQPDEEEIEEIKSSIKRDTMKRFSSLNTLFSRGVLQLLNWSKDGIVRTSKVKAAPATVFFRVDGPLISDEEYNMLKALQSNSAIFNDRLLIGTRFQISEEDYYTKTGVKEVYAKIDAVRKEGFSKEVEDKFLQTKFRQGPSLWIDDIQTGKVLLCQVGENRRWFKLWMDDFKSI